MGGARGLKPFYYHISPLVERGVCGPTQGPSVCNIKDPLVLTVDQLLINPDELPLLPPPLILTRFSGV